MGGGLTLADVVAELHNWRRWRWAGMPNLNTPPPPAFEGWRPYGDGREAGWGDVDASSSQQPIDGPAAEATHDLIWKMPPVHRGYIYDHWYLQLRVYHKKVEAAHGILVDMMNSGAGEEWTRRKSALEAEAA